MTVSNVEAAEALDWIRRHNALVIDVREPSEYADGHIPGALSIPQSDLADRLSELPEDRPTIVACASGSRSMRAAGFLKAGGYDRVFNLAGGTNGWKEVGNPVATEH